jgi:hypothetical protein
MSILCPITEETWSLIIADVVGHRSRGSYGFSVGGGAASLPVRSRIQHKLKIPV